MVGKPGQLRAPQFPVAQMLAPVEEPLVGWLPAVWFQP